MQSSLSDAKPKAALEAVVNNYTEYPTTLNTVAIEQFRAQLPTYLTSANPPDVLTWYAGSVARDYASKGLLLDLSDLWTGDGACANFSPALKSLSSDKDGKQIFVPTNYYWWSIFYRKSAFEEWDVQPPTSWDDFMALLDTLKGKGVAPLTNGTGSTPWMASGWFDYLNLRINGADFHRELLYQPAGPINAGLAAIGIDTGQHQWLADPTTALGAILVAAIWRQAGYIMVLYLAGLKGCDPSLEEAAAVDGASWWQRFVHIVLPQLRNVNTVVFAVTVIDSLRTFDIVWAMTRGGPYNSTQLLSTYMYQVGFTQVNLGYGSAIAVVIFLLAIAFIITYLVRATREE